MSNNKKTILLFTALSSIMVSLLLYGCSTVFTASISGSVIDKDAWEDNEETVGIADVEIFLYDDEDNWNNDFTRWNDEGLRPDEVEEEEETNYFLSTVTGEDGSFSFNGIIWDRLFPSYGKSGDRVEIYFLFYNRDYGISQNTTPTYIVSDVTNQLTSFKLERITNSAVIEGTVVNTNTSTGVGSVNIEVYVATALSPATYPDDSDYQAVTDADGTYSVEFSFDKALGDYGKVKLIVDRNSYNCEAYDGDGTPSGDYYESGLIEEDTTYTAEDIGIKQTEFTETLEGRIATDLTDEATYTNGVKITLEYTDPDSGSAVTKETYSQNHAVGDTEIEKGYFIFTNLQWEDSDYTGSRSEVTCTLSYELSGTSLTGTPSTYTLQGNEDNYVAVEYTP